MPDAAASFALALSDAGWQRLADLLQRAVGLDLPAGSRALVAARLAPRLRRLGLADVDAYLALLDGEGGSAELAIALDLLTTQHAGFFREPAQFELLESELSTPRRPRLRLWSAAAGFGDEAYSLAMLLADLQKAGRIGADWSVLGTDISERRLRSAAEALYAEARLRQVGAERLQRHALGNGGLVQMQAGLRERVRFERHDLREPLAGDEVFDAVLLRQLLIYFDAATRGRVISHALARLRPGGLFFVAAAEQGLVDAAGLQALGGGAFRKKT